MLHSLEKALAGRNFELTLSHPRGPVRDMLQKASKVIKEHNGKLKSLASRTFDSINEAIAGKADDDAAQVHESSIAMITIHTKSAHGDSDGGEKDASNVITSIERRNVSESLGH